MPVPAHTIPARPSLLLVCPAAEGRDALAASLAAVFVVRTATSLTDALFELTTGFADAIIASGPCPDGDPDLLLAIAAEVAPNVRRIRIDAGSGARQRGAEELALKSDLDHVRVVTATERLLHRSAGSAGKRLRVLVVDGDRLFRAVTARALATEFDVDVAGSKQEVMLALAQAPFDVVVADFDIAGESGIELLGELRAGYPRVARVLTSALTQSRRALDACETGSAHRFVPRPSDAAALVAAVRAANGCVPHPRPASQSAVYVDDSGAPLVRVFVWRPPTDAQWRAYLDDMRQLPASRGTHAVVVIERVVSTVSAAQRLQQFEWLQNGLSRHGGTCAAVARVLPAGSVRTPRVSSMVLSGGAAPESTFTTLEDAEAWARGVLESHSAPTLRPPPSS